MPHNVALTVKLTSVQQMAGTSGRRLEYYRNRMELKC